MFATVGAVAGIVSLVMGPMLLRGFNSVAKTRGILAPKLFMHGDHDDIIPLRLGQALFAAAPDPKSFWIVEGAGHNDILETAGPRYRERLEAFYESLNYPRMNAH